MNGKVLIGTVDPATPSPEAKAKAKFRAGLLIGVCSLHQIDPYKIIMDVMKSGKYTEVEAVDTIIISLTTIGKIHI